MKKCKHPKCGREFKPTREWQKFCSQACRLGAWADRVIKKRKEAK